MIDSSVAGISRRTIEKIINAWYKSGNAPPVIRPDIPEEDEKLLIKQISECINEEKTGEISRQAKVIHLAMIYIGLSKEGKKKFLKILALEFDIDADNLNRRIKKLTSAADDKELIKAELKLSDALVPPRVKFLRKLINLPNGFIFLKDMRKDLLSFVKTAPRLKKLDKDIKNLLITYFDINLLDLREITWNSSAAMLERLMKYEAVHEIPTWKDLKYRLFTDRRVFAFFHSKMPNDPLIFVEVALVKGMPGSIQKLLDINQKPMNPLNADTAIFYSISSTQKGLAGISFGNFLIKRVVKKLSSELKNLKNFATLSPVPLFLSWLKQYLTAGGETFFTEEENKSISQISGNKHAAEGILEILQDKEWCNKSETSEILKKPLMRLCTHYLVNVKRKDIIAYDPVANFHLSNGAKIRHIHWLGDVSKKGIKQSAGIMLNYHYELGKIEKNHETYRTKGIVCISEDAGKWLE